MSIRVVKGHSHVNMRGFRQDTMALQKQTKLPGSASSNALGLINFDSVEQTTPADLFD